MCKEATRNIGWNFLSSFRPINSSSILFRKNDPLLTGDRFLLEIFLLGLDSY